MQNIKNNLNAIPFECWCQKNILVVAILEMGDQELVMATVGITGVPGSYF